MPAVLLLMALIEPCGETSSSSAWRLCRLMENMLSGKAPIIHDMSLLHNSALSCRRWSVRLRSWPSLQC